MKQIIISATAFMLLSCGPAKQTDEDAEPASSSDAPVIQSSDTARKNLVQENIFDDKDYLHGFVKDQSCCDYSVQQVNGALRFEVRKTDEDVSKSKRAEVTGKGYANEERWYGFRIRLEDWVYDDAGESVIQWHPKSNTGTANVSLWANSGKYTLVISPHGSDNMYYELDSVVPNKNTDFVLHIKWSKEDDGFVEIWKDGKYLTGTMNNKTLPYKGITSELGCYLKLGINKFGWSYEPAKTQSTSAKRVIYFEEYREGNEKARYKDVKPGTD
jgi:hypothetical protein